MEKPKTISARNFVNNLPYEGEYFQPSDEVYYKEPIDEYINWLKGDKNMDITEMFKRIEKYHKALGYSLRTMELEKQMEAIRNGGLALQIEVAELVNSFPWKPWRNINDQEWSKSNAIEEIVDCLFFLGFIMEAADIHPGDVQLVFLEKLRENYDRIKRSYNNKSEDRKSFERLCPICSAPLKRGHGSVQCTKCRYTK